MYSKMTAIRPRALTPFGDTFADPYGWTDVCPSGTGTPNAVVGFDVDTYESLLPYYAVYLMAGVEYTIRGVNAVSGSPNARIDLYDESGTKVAYNAGSWNAEYTEYTVADLVYTPAVSGEYVFNVQDGDEMGMGGECTFGMTVSPRPETLSKTGPTPWESPTGLGDFNSLYFQRSAKNTGLTPFDFWQSLAAWEFVLPQFMEWLRRWRYNFWLQFQKQLVLAPLRDYSSTDLLGNTIQTDASYNWDTYTLGDGTT